MAADAPSPAQQDGVRLNRHFPFFQLDGIKAAAKSGSLGRAIVNEFADLKNVAKFYLTGCEVTVT